MPRASSRRSTCLARTSASTFTSSPGPSAPSVVAASVCGTSAIATQPGPRSAIVRLTPSSVIEPFSTESRAISAGSSTVRRAPSPSGSSARTRPTAVDVALDDVAAERLAGAQGRLDVHARARLEAGEGRAGDRLRNGVEGDRSRSSAATAVRQTPFTATESPSAVRAAASGAWILRRAPFAVASTASTVPNSRTIPVNTPETIVGAGLELACADGGAVGADLGHVRAELRGVEAHGDDRVRVQLPRRPRSAAGCPARGRRRAAWSCPSARRRRAT